MSRGIGWFFSVLLPGDCRICGSALVDVSRVPVCGSCFDSLVPFEAEHYCVCCRTPFLNARPLNEQGQCPRCVAGINQFDAVYSFGSYDGALRELLHLFKYEGVTPLAGKLGALMARTAPRDTRFDAVVPMPLHWWRGWRRGYNQAELLAREVARRLGEPLEKPIKRRRATGTQTGLTAAARRRNVSGAFRVSDAEKVRGRRLLLVDDVLTTGATVNACAGALKAAGARYVAVLTLARADRREQVEVYRSPEAVGLVSSTPGASL